ncbi:hypothetical protein GUJ93_ZPchr0014g47222 [Zizania palustris]|uniref:Uncharacterized protein n=1 Tax=Zizania palustris TaxID=103762 RepID=A0A8J5THS4_ZIZPA|nr:hypothetical protein GUJ93_ZPchr0014g47222 [Zizania palustris]
MQTMAAATTVDGTTSCVEAAAHTPNSGTPNSGGAALCRAAATDSGVVSCRGLRQASEGSGAPLPGGVAAGPPGRRHCRWRLGEGSTALLSGGAAASQGSAALRPSGAATGLGPATLLLGGGSSPRSPSPSLPAPRCLLSWLRGRGPLWSTYSPRSAWRKSLRPPSWPCSGMCAGTQATGSSWRPGGDRTKIFSAVNLSSRLWIGSSLSSMASKRFIMAFNVSSTPPPDPVSSSKFMATEVEPISSDTKLSSAGILGELEGTKLLN